MSKECENCKFETVIICQFDSGETCLNCGYQVIREIVDEETLLDIRSLYKDEIIKNKWKLQEI